MERGETIPTTRWPGWLNPAALPIESWIAIAAFALQVTTDADVVAVAFPPWWSTQQVFLAAASANAAVVRRTALSGLLVVRPDDNDGLTQLRKAGAWLIIDPQAVAACITR